MDKDRIDLLRAVCEKEPDNCIAVAVVSLLDAMDELTEDNRSLRIRIGKLEERQPYGN